METALSNSILESNAAVSCLEASTTTFLVLKSSMVPFSGDNHVTSFLLPEKCKKPDGPRRMESIIVKFLMKW